MKKNFLLTVILLMLSSLAFSQVIREELFWEKFRESNLGWVGTKMGNGWTTSWMFGNGNCQHGQWALSVSPFGYDIQTRGDGEDLSSGYEGASGIGRIVSWDGIAFGGIVTKEYRDIWLSFGVKASSISTFKFEYSVDGGVRWTDLAPAAEDIVMVAGSDGWYLATIKKSFPAAGQLAINITSSGAHPNIDDIRVTAEKDYSASLAKHIAECDLLYESAVEGMQLNMYLPGSKAALKTVLDQAKETLDAPYNGADALAADNNLVAAKSAFEAKQLTETNAPNIDAVSDQPYSFSNEEKTINLTGIKAVGSGASVSSVTAVSKKGNCIVNPVTGSGENRSFTYTGNPGSYGKDTIVVTVQQNATPTGVISDRIEVSFAVEILDASVNIPPVMNKVPDQYNVLSNGLERTITLTGISPVNPGQTITSVTASSDNPDLVISEAVNFSSVNTTGTAILKYTAVYGKTGEAPITITIQDDGAGTDSGSNTATETFKIYFYTEKTMAATFDNPGTKEVMSGLRETQILLPNIRNAANISEGFGVEVLSGGELLDETPTFIYDKENKDLFAVMNVKLTGNAGNIKFKVSIDGKNGQEFDLHIYQYSNPGINLQVYDVSRNNQPNVIFGGAVPVYEETVQTALYPAETNVFWCPLGWHTTNPTDEQIAASKWNSFFWSMTATTCSSSPCNADPIPDLITLGMKGFFIPEKTGAYSFQFGASEYFAGGMFLDQTGTSWKEAQKVAYVGTSGNVGLISGNTVTSDEIILEKGKVYPIYAVRFIIHRHTFNLKVKGPDDDVFNVISANQLAFTYDTALPDAPTGVKINTVFANRLQVVWNAVASGAKVAKVKGYNFYLNGEKMNTELIVKTDFILEGLQASTDYQVFVTAVDELGNESFISNIARATTLINSTEKPSGDIIAQELGKTGQTVKLKWSGAVAPFGSAIAAYDVAVGGTEAEHIINSDYIYADTCFVKGLEPEKEYDVYIRAYTASMVQGDWSGPQKISTVAFDPEDEFGLEYGEYRVALDVEIENVSWNEGVGINGSYKSSGFYSNTADDAEKAMTVNMKPGAIRWGALDANMYGLLTVTGDTDAAGNYASSIGKIRKDKGLPTHGMNMNFANEIGAMYSLCIGMKQGLGGLGTSSGDYYVDYMEGVDVSGSTPNISGAKAKTFRILFEYLAGPDDSEGGQIRVEEGLGAEPLLTKEKSKGLILEFGNEVWGSTSHNAHLGKNYTQYVQWCRNMSDSVRALPFWEDIKDLVYFTPNGRSPGVDTNGSAVFNGDKDLKLRTISVTGYIDGNILEQPDVPMSETYLGYYRGRQITMKTNLQSLEAALKEQIAISGSPRTHYFYETQSSTSTYFGKLGQAVVLSDYITASFKYGGITPAIFLYSSSGQWQVNPKLPNYWMAYYINNYCKGHVLQSSVRSNNRLIDGDNIPYEGHDPVGTSVYNNGTQWSILLFSRDFANDYTVQLNLPESIGEIKNAKCIIITGDENGSGFDATIDFLLTEEDVALSNGQLVTVPKYSMVLYTFEANDPGFEQLPLGYFEYPKAEQLIVDGPSEITTRYGTAVLTGTVLPEDAYVKTVIWEINSEDNFGNSPLPSIIQQPGTNYITVSANVRRLCDGDYYVRASLASNPSVTVLHKITVSNQGNDCTTSLDELSESGSTFIYPNPVEDVLFVNTSSSEEAIAIKIYNQMGVLVLSKTFGQGQIELNVSGLVSGIYFVKIEQGGTSGTVKMFKK